MSEEFKSGTDEKHRSPFHTNMFRSLRSAWTQLPESWRHQMWTWAGPRWQGAYARQMIAKPSAVRSSDPNAPLVVAGLFNTANGIGEGARATYRALRAAGHAPIAVDLSAPFAPVDMATDIDCQAMPETEEGTLILQLNGPETMSAMQYLGMEYGRRWYTIGYWAWELPSFPDQWDAAFRYLSEIWTISDFAASAIGQHPNAPSINVFGHAVSPPEGLRAARSKFGWSKDEFVFLTMADSMSSLQRKNPFSTIRAFKAAFGDDPKYRLVIKTRNLERHETARTDLTIEMDGNSNIQILDQSLSERDVWSLVKSADSVVSLHRSEGFGLVLAEAMALGKPVICTDWSGNMDFTCTDSAALVPSTLIPVADDYGIYRNTDAQWAAVDEQAAAEQMIRIANDGGFRSTLAKAAKTKISALANPTQVGEQMVNHLDKLPRTPATNGLIK